MYGVGLLSGSCADLEHRGVGNHSAEYGWCVRRRWGLRGLRRCGGPIALAFRCAHHLLAESLFPLCFELRDHGIDRRAYSNCSAMSAANVIWQHPASIQSRTCRSALRLAVSIWQSWAYCMGILIQQGLKFTDTLQVAATLGIYQVDIGATTPASAYHRCAIARIQRRCLGRLYDTR
ncbi:MAG: hypothetical protein GPOALKHO_000379 [Sodalis sp.]|nr:MAG: hypothetical protein GPOALKHO_000379 [Sodalis sp.]